MAHKYNIKILDSPEEVDMIEWAFSHPNCNALIVKEVDDSETMKIIAYAINEQGNKEISVMRHKDDNTEIFCGIDKSMINSLGGII